MIRSAGKSTVAKQLPVVTAAEMERLSPDERARLLNDRVVTDLSQVSPEFLARVLDKGRRLVDEHRNLTPDKP